MWYVESSDDGYQQGLLMHTGIRLTITLGDDPVYIADSDDMYISTFMQTGQLNRGYGPIAAMAL